MSIQYLALLFSLNAIAYCNNSSIQGHIIDTKSDEPLIGANIILEDTILGAASDENGHYMITNVPIGSYTIRAMFIGYETLKKELWITSSQEYTIDIKLIPSVLELQETRVTAEKRKEKITGAPASI